MLAGPCFSLMDRHTLIQHFRHIISFASLACTFTTLRTIQYSMWDHCDNNNMTAQDHNSTDFSASSSTQDTPASVSTSENIKKTSGQWTESEIMLLLNYVKANCVFMTAWGLSLKKSEFNKAHAMVKSKDAAQCHYKWGHVHFSVNNKGFHYWSSIIAMYDVQGNFGVGQEVW